MAADVLSQAGISVDLYDAMPSMGRKLLRAGIGGLNITHSEPYTFFCQRYGPELTSLQSSLDQFPPTALRTWVHALGIETFIGTSGRVFPKEMKAAPLLRAWLHRLRTHHVRLHVRHRWVGWSKEGDLRINSPTGELLLKPTATVFALGGASWPKLGSDGSWISLFQDQAINIRPLESANCGFTVPWSEFVQQRFSGAPLKSITLTFVDHNGQRHYRQGECIISHDGIEGSLIYALSRPLRETIRTQGQATFYLDLAPNWDQSRLLDLLCRRGNKSISSYLKSTLKFNALKTALLYEQLGPEQLRDIHLLASTIKSLPITVYATQPLSEAISTAGGVHFSELNEQLMLKNKPGIFIAGEMLDWEAPTGGYLLNGCLATGLTAGQGALNWLSRQNEPGSSI